MMPKTKLLLLVVLLVGSGVTTKTKGQSTADPSFVGQWSPVFDLPYKAVHLMLLPSGDKLLFWPSFEQGDNPQLWDIATGAISPATQSGWNIFCAGHAFLPDGRLFVAGGHSNSCPHGLPNAAIYDGRSNSWTQLPNMNAGRWYPTATTLGNGDILVMAGTIDPSVGQNALPQMWQISTNSWRDLTTAQRVQPLYPRAFLAPNGKVYIVGPYQATRYLDTAGTGKWSSIIAKSQCCLRTYGSAVMYNPGKILIVGGGDPPTATAEIINVEATLPAWQYTAPMAYARRQHNATLLPDGTVLVTGGSSGSGFDNKSAPVYAAEIWDPASGAWKTMASMAVYRGYHGTAVLLPDGRVFSAGGEKSPNNAEIFSPPYFFKGARPTISASPASASYGQTIQIVTPDAASIARLTLLGIGADTHAINMNQRINVLSFTKAPGILNVTMPAQPNLAPPGYYMLFIVNQDGVPSVAKIISVS